MAVTDTLFLEMDGNSNNFLPKVDSNVLEAQCPECGEALRLGMLDPLTTGGYSVPFVFCKSNCDLRGYAF